MIREVLYYQLSNGQQPFTEWLLSFTDKRVQARILARLDRVRSGSFGDTKLVDTGIWELRFHFGPGHRVYFGLDGQVFVILLCGGDKSTQDSDIQCARAYWTDYIRRKI
jgi:putative addiction module killer protein